MLMRFLLLAISAVILTSCAGAKHVNIESVKTEEQFAKAKQQIYKNFHSCYHLDAPWAEDPRTCAEFLAQDMQKLMHKLEETIPNTLIANIEETRLSLYMYGSLYAKPDVFGMLLFEVQNRDSLEASSKGLPEIGASSIYEERVLTQAIYYEYTISIISKLNISREDKEFLWLYLKYFILKYGFNIQNGELKDVIWKNASYKQDWFSTQAQKYNSKYPENIYKDFLMELKF